MTTQVLQDAVEFVWREADMLDHGEHDPWLALWDPEGKYVVPIDEKTEDFDNCLNYAYDDHAMRVKRVRRLVSGESISTLPRARTVRSLSRFRLIEDKDGIVTLRCAQLLYDFRKVTQHTHVADVTFKLRRTADDFLILQKVIRLINSTDALQSVGYIL